jgi:uncharacterized membrane protein
VNARKKISALLPLLLWIAYPVIIFFGLQILEPRYVAGLLALLLLARWRQGMYRMISRMPGVHIAVMGILLALAIAATLSNSEVILRIYPAAMSMGMLLLFGLSLKYPPSMIEVIARLTTPDLSVAGIQYTRTVTQVWCLFFIVNGGFATYTALYASRDIWALYNGLIAYIAMAVLFASEWLIRHRFIARHKPNA